MIKKLFYHEDLIYLALIISLALHLTVGGGSVLIKKEDKKTVKRKKIEVQYRSAVQQEPQIKKNKEKSVEKKIKQEKITLTDSLSAVSLIKENIQKPESLKVYERTPEKVKTFNAVGNKSVSVPALQSEKINNPSYSNYYSLVRARIWQRAKFNYSEFYTGEVYLTFVLLSDGTLKAVQILENRTNAEQYLRTIGLKSVKEAAPFPVFPKELRYPELTFNVVISFQVKEELGS